MIEYLFAAAFYAQAWDAPKRALCWMQVNPTRQQSALGTIISRDNIVSACISDFVGILVPHRILCLKRVQAMSLSLLKSSAAALFCMGNEQRACGPWCRETARARDDRTPK